MWGSNLTAGSNPALSACHFLKSPLPATVVGFLLEIVHFPVTMPWFKIWDRWQRFLRRSPQSLIFVDIARFKCRPPDVLLNPVRVECVRLQRRLDNGQMWGDARQVMADSAVRVLALATCQID